MPLEGYYWYVPSLEDRHVYPDLDEPQAVQVVGESVYLCGSDMTYDYGNLKGNYSELIIDGCPNCGQTLGCENCGRTY